MMFLKCVKQAIDIDTNSRYIVEFYNNACTVPEQFDDNKQTASEFFKEIKAPHKNLIYTKTDNGKKILLKYKLRALNRMKKKEQNI